MCVLEFVDCFAELFSFFNIFQSFVDSALSDTYRLSTDTDTTAIQSNHSDFEAHAFFANQVSSRNNNVFVDNFTVGSSSNTHTFDVSTYCNAFGVQVYDECRHTFEAFGFICQCKYDTCISKAGVCCEDFGTVDDVVIAIFNSYCLATTSVCTSTWFCQTKGTDCSTIDHWSQVCVFLFFGTELVDTRTAKGSMYGHCDTCGSIYFRNFFHSQCVCQNVCALTAVFSGVRNPEHTCFLKFCDKIHAVFFSFVHVFCNGFDFCFSKFSEKFLLKQLGFC